ncbi:MAG: glycosyltransferase [Pseudomonas sp.]
MAAKEKRVLQFCHSYYGPFLDCARQYAALFEGTGYKVTTVFLTGEKDPEVAAGCHSDEVIFLGFSTRAVRGLKLGAIRAMRKLAAERNFSFCIAHRVKPMYVACWATGLPVFGISHSYGDYLRPGRRLFARLFRDRLHLLGVSDSVRDEIRQCMPTWPEDRLHTLYNRIDVAAVQAQQVGRGEARQVLGLSPDAWVVGNVGRLHPDKDQHTLLRGFAAAKTQLPDNACLAIMGAGRLEQELKTLASTLGLGNQVVFLGQVADGRRYFKAFDVFALSSDHEPFGMVLLEAMAAGLPLIVSDCGGAPEVVGDLGLRFPFGDDQALATALVKAVAALPSTEQWLQRLQDKFSDQAVRQQFWQMSAVKQLTD